MYGLFMTLAQEAPGKNIEEMCKKLTGCAPLSACLSSAPT